MTTQNPARAPARRERLLQTSPRSWVTVPNLITLNRLLLLVPMWWLAATGHARLLGVLVGFCLFTDFLDGFIARRTGSATHFGAALDASADNLLLVSSPVWLYWLEPGIWRDHPIWVSLYLAALVAVFGVMAVKFRRNVELHTYAAKLGIVIYWSFVIHSLSFGYHSGFFYLAMVTSYYFLGEDLYLLLSRDELDENIHSFLSP